MSVLGIVLTLAATVLFAGFVLLGARIDGRRQALRNKGLHPTTTAEGKVEPLETKHQEGKH